MIYDLAHRNVALLVVDVQREYFDESGPAYVPAAAERLEAINGLIEAFRAIGAPVVQIRHAHRPDGSDGGRLADFLPDDDEPSFVEGTERVAFAEGLAVAPSDVIVTKNRYDAFAGTDLDLVLRGAGTRAVVVCGFMTSFCCTSTARTAHTLDYETLFVRDAVDGPDLERFDGAPYPHTEVLDDTCALLGAGFAEIVTTTEVLDRLGGGN